MYKSHDPYKEALIRAEANCEQVKLNVEQANATKKITLSNFVKEQSEKFNQENPPQEYTGLSPEKISEIVTKLSTQNRDRNAKLLILKQQQDNYRHAGIQ